MQALFDCPQWIGQLEGSARLVFPANHASTGIIGRLREP
jgi:hypothetical protein